jgi:hypothetical protein
VTDLEERLARAFPHLRVAPLTELGDEEELAESVAKLRAGPMLSR